MTKERKSAGKAIKKMLSESNNKMFMGMVHHVYGPLRGLNYVLVEPNVEEVLDCLDEQSLGLELADQMQIVADLESRSPVNVVETAIKIWKETGLAVHLLILPYEIVVDAENPPIEVESIEEGRKQILQNLALTAPLHSKDIFFFRRGII